MAQVPITDFYAIVRDAVRLYPATSPVRKCAQPQSFRVLQADRGAEVLTENLGATVSDKDSPFFWSRQWELAKYNPNKIGFDWPLVTLFEAQNEAIGSPFEKGFKRCYTLEISVLDVYRDDCQTGKHTGCEARTVNQIFLDTEAMLDAVLKYLGKMVIATTSADPMPRYYNLDWLAAAVSNGDITSWDVQPGGELGAQLVGDNRTASFQRVEIAQKKIYGTKTQFRFCTHNCASVSFNLESPTFGVLAFEAGCRDCQ